MSLVWLINEYHKMKPFQRRVSPRFDSEFAWRCATRLKIHCQDAIIFGFYQHAIITILSDCGSRRGVSHYTDTTHCVALLHFRVRKKNCPVSCCLATRLCVRKTSKMPNCQSTSFRGFAAAGGERWRSLKQMGSGPFSFTKQHSRTLTQAQHNHSLSSAICTNQTT